MDEKELIDYKHKLKMQELEFERESEEKKLNGFKMLEERKHAMKMEENRVFFAENRKMHERKQRIKELENSKYLTNE